MKLKQQIKSIVLNSDQAIDVYNISKEIGCTSYIIVKLLLENLIEELERKNPEIFKELEIRPLKTTKSLVFIPQSH